jgi:prephenate dehydrogenase
VHLRDPADHDVEVAWMSHVPHVLAYAFADALAAAPTAAREVAGAGFRDFTRIARSEPELWGDILTANRKALSAPLQAAGEALARMARAIEANDSDALERTIAAARDTLAHYPQRTKPLAAERMQDESDEGHSTRNEP